MRSLDEWLAYQAQLHPQPIDLGLERLRRVLDRLGWARPPVPVITVAGTNGKGSVVAYCAAMLKAAGYRAGTFTSPHLRDYRERIRLDGAPVSSEALIRAFERIEAARAGVSLTFFEYNALAALLILDAAQLDAWVLEIGMGGRLDAVNVVDPTVSVVVSIGLDHQEFLGATLESIAREKAGILRPGAAAVLASPGMPPVLEATAQAMGASLKRAGTEYTTSRQGDRWSYRGPRWDLRDLPPPALLGEAQYGNAAAAVAALEELAPAVTVPAAAVARGLASVQLAGRFQIIRAATASEPLWILDVAHNPDAARMLAQNLRALPGSGRTFAVCGMLGDKDAGAVAAVLNERIDGWWTVATVGARGIEGTALVERIAPHVTAPVSAARDLPSGCAAALAAAGPKDRIVVFGSFHTVGPALDWLESRGVLKREIQPEYTAATR